jgi:hypothetical protein
VDRAARAVNVPILTARGAVVLMTRCLFLDPSCQFNV